MIEPVDDATLRRIEAAVGQRGVDAADEQGWVPGSGRTSSESPATPITVAVLIDTRTDVQRPLPRLDHPPCRPWIGGARSRPPSGCRTPAHQGCGSAHPRELAGGGGGTGGISRSSSSRRRRWWADILLHRHLLAVQRDGWRIGKVLPGLQLSIWTIDPVLTRPTCRRVAGLGAAAVGQHGGVSQGYRRGWRC